MLLNGELKVLAGSIVYVPNGVGVFDKVVVESDLSLGDVSGAATEKRVLYYQNGLLGFVYASFMSSGSSASPTNINWIWYDTTNNLIKRTANTGSTWTSGASFPLCIFTITNGTGVTSIDQVFNGFGYIGSTIFALPGVKGLIPNGWNKDGSLKNIKFTTSNILLQQTTYNAEGAFLGVSPDTVNYVTLNDVVYDKNDNKNKLVSTGEQWRGCLAGFVSVSNMKFTSVLPKTTFHVVDYNDFNTKQDAATAVTYDNITNCITEISRDIKLGLSNGNIILKAGSVVYVPNGKNADDSNKFDKVLITEDVSLDASDGTATATEWVIFYQPNTKTARNSRTISNFSGSTAPTVTSTYAVWYDTANNVIKYTNDNGATWTTNYTSFPICMFTRTNGTASSIDRIFNGFGYIGKTMYVLPGVLGLAPDGRDVNGKIQNLSINIASVKTINVVATTQVQTNLRLSNDGIAAGLLNYNFMDNINYDSSNLPFSGINLGYLQFDGTKITQFLVKNTLRVLDYNDKSTISGWSMPSENYDVLTLGASGTEYIAPANGYFYFQGTSSASGQRAAFFNRTNTAIGTVVGISFFSSASGQVLHTFVPAAKGDSVLVNYTATTNLLLHFVYAEGER